MTANKKSVLAISGSPHKNGKTAAMMDIAIRRAEEKGYIVTEINLYEKNISFCKIPLRSADLVSGFGRWQDVHACGGGCRTRNGIGAKK